MDDDISAAWESYVAQAFVPAVVGTSSIAGGSCGSGVVTPLAPSLASAPTQTQAPANQQVAEDVAAEMSVHESTSEGLAAHGGTSLLNLAAVPQRPRHTGRRSALLQQFLQDVDDGVEVSPQSFGADLGPAMAPEIPNSVLEGRHAGIWSVAAYMEKSFMDGHALDSSTSLPHLLEALDAYCSAGSKLENIFSKMAEFYLEDENFHMISGALQEEKFGLSYQHLQRRMKKLACAYMIFQKYEKLSLDHMFEQRVPMRYCVAYLEFCSYDETPMLVSIKDTESSMALAKQLLDGTVPVEDNPLSLPLKQLVLPALASKAKLLQVKSSFGCVLNLLGTHVLIFGSLVKPVTAMAKNDANSLLAALHKDLDISSVDKHFSLRCRGVCLDKAATNNLAEKVEVSQRDSVWQGLHVDCACHVLHTIFKKLFQLCPLDVTGLIQWALSIREGGKFAWWRQALADEIMGRDIKFVAKPLFGEAKTYKAELMHLLYSRDQKSLVKLTALEMVMTGDWRNPNVIEFAVAENEALPDKHHLKQLMVKVLLFCLANQQPIIFPRHRWTGAEEALSYCLLLGCVHNLLVPSYERFVRLINNKQSGHGGISEDPSSGTLVQAAAGVGSSDCHLGDNLGLAEDGGAMAADVVDGKNPDMSDAQTYSALNAKNRKEALMWLSHYPLPRLLVLRIIVGPLTVALAQQLQSSGWEYEQNELSKMAESMIAGTLHEARNTRLYQLVLAATGKIEGACRDAFVMLLTASVWALFPMSSRTLAFRSLCHRLLSRAGAAMYQLFAVPHMQFPVCLFKLLQHPEMCCTFDELPECVLDEWALALKRRFESFGEPMCLSVLQSQAQLLKTDIAGLESHHSSIRRLLVARSLQTHSLNLDAASAEWILQNSRRKGQCKGVKTRAWQKQDVLGKRYPTIDSVVFSELVLFFSEKRKFQLYLVYTVWN
eukprot:6477934-Amphidinium_carterae.1